MFASNSKTFHHEAFAMVLRWVVLLAILCIEGFCQWQSVARREGADVARFHNSPGGTLYAQLRSGLKVFGSYDGGISWDEVLLPQLEGAAFFAPCADSLGLEALVFVTGSAFYRSTDNAFSWQEIPQPTGINAGNKIVDIQGLRYGELVILTETNDGYNLYLSRDNSSSFVFIGQLPRMPWHIYQAHDSAIYCYGEGLYQVSYQPPSLVQRSSGTFTSLTSTRESGSGSVTLWAVRNGTVLRSTDNGVQWIDASSGIGGPLDATLVSGTDGSLFCFVSEGTNGDSTAVYALQATTWRLYSRQPFVVSDVTVAFNGTILIATDAGIFRSEDGGRSWMNSSAGIQGIGVTCVSFHPLVGLIIATSSGHLYRSVDNGVSWSPGFRLPNGAHVTDCWIEPPNIVVVGTSRGLWCSTSQGASYLRCATSLGPITDTIVAVASFRGNILAATRTNIIVSSDGVSWTIVPISLPPGSSIVSLRKYDSAVVIALNNAVVQVRDINQTNTEILATTSTKIRACDVAEDGTIGILVDSAGTLFFQRLRSNGTAETTFSIGREEPTSFALSYGGRAWIGLQGRIGILTIPRTSQQAMLDTTIAEPVLFIRRQPTLDVYSSSAYGGIFRYGRDSLTSVTTHLHTAPTIWPTPASEYLHIEAQEGISDATISDYLGRNVLSIQFGHTPQQATIATSTLAPGYYMLNIRTCSHAHHRMSLLIVR